MVIQANQVLEVIWIVWLMSWVAASFWSDRPQKRVATLQSRVRSADERPWHRADHLRRHGRRDRHRRRVFQGARLRRLAGACAQADLHWRPHHSRQHIEARNRYLRVLFVQAAWVTLVKVSPNRWEGHGLKPWIEAAKKRLHHNVLAIALANKLARIAWSVLARGRGFEASKLQVV